MINYQLINLTLSYFDIGQMRSESSDTLSSYQLTVVSKYKENLESVKDPEIQGVPKKNYLLE